MHVGVVGINHKLADLKLRELLAKACQRRFGHGNAIHGDQIFVLLSTCNRTEVYFTSEDLTLTHSYLLNILRSEVDEEFDHKLYSYFGIDCFHHLVRVTAGLDSAIVAETEIQGQVKYAYESFSLFATMPKVIHFLFQKALQIGKQVRTRLSLGHGVPDLEHALLQVGKNFFTDFQHTRVLFIGASVINRKILNFFQTKGIKNITLCNRSQENAEASVDTSRIHLMDWHQLGQWQCFDWVIVGTKAPDYLLGKEKIVAPSKKLVIDLSVPRNVSPKLGQCEEVTLLNIDQINRTLKNRKQQMAHTLCEAEEFVLVAAKKHADLFIQKSHYAQSHTLSAV